MQMVDRTQVVLSNDNVITRAIRSWRDRIILAVVLLVLLGLFARIMTYPLQHDEQFYLPAAILFSFDRLYSDLGFSHLPNLPILLSGIFATIGSEYYVVIGRLVIFASWLMTVAALIRIGRKYAHSDLVAALLVALLVANPALIDATGMAVTNNFIATPFALFGLIAFIDTASRPYPSRRLAALAGFLLAVAMGFKANYIALLPPIAIAALFVPPHLAMRTRLMRIALPMLAGGVIGGAPTLYFLAQDPSGFIAHVVSFHRGPQISYWQAHADPLDPKTMSLSAKAILAQRGWLSGTNLIVLIALAFYATLGFRQWQFQRWFAPATRWPILVLIGILALLAVMSFLPTPAFPQYFTTPLPFAIMLIALLHGSLNAHSRSVAGPFLIAALGMAVLIGAPILLSTMPKALSVARWTGFQVHRDAVRMAEALPANSEGRSMATLSPVYALEGGLDVYPALAMGPFVYRASAWIPAADQRHYTSLASPATVGALLETAPPAAILTGMEGALDAPLSAFAVAHGYSAHRVALGRGAPAGEITLFTKPMLPMAPLALGCAAQPASSGSGPISAPGCR